MFLGQLVGFLLFFSLATVASACKKSQTSPPILENGIQGDISYVENDNFLTQYPEPSSDPMIAPPPDMFTLPVKIHMAPSWARKFGDTAKAEAETVLRQAKEMLLHPSLKIKFFLSYDDSSFILNAKEVDASDPGLSELANHVSGPAEGRAAIVYLTAAQDGLYGTANTMSICDEKKKLSRCIVRWNSTSKDTALTMAHEICHILGSYHDFDKYTSAGNKVLLSKRTSTCGPGKWEGGPTNQIMNYGQPMISSWSDCTNQDLLAFYERVVANDGKFCLDKHEQRVSKPAGPPEILQVASSGESGVKQGTRMGLFFLVEGASHNGHPVWEMDTNAYKLFYGAGGRWCIGTPEDNTGGIKTAETGLVLPPVSGWEYHDGEWIPDQHLTVQAGPPTFPAKIRLTSTGPAKDEHPYTMGEYVKTTRLSNFRPVYRNQEDDGMFLFYSGRGFWTIGSNTSKTAGWIQSKYRGKILPPHQDWKYGVVSSNTWAQDDSLVFTVIN